jgi:uncharacterized protein (DUF433 family)
MSLPTTSQTPVLWKHLEANPKSHYKQLFIKGTRIRAEIVYGWTVDGSEPATPETVAAGYQIPLDAVLEAIAYCQGFPPELDHDHRRERLRMKATGMSDPAYSGTPRVLSASEVAQLELP